MKNKELKKDLIRNGTFNAYSQQRYNLFNNHEFSKIDKATSYFDNYGEQFNEEKHKACQEIKHARKKQRSKIKDHFLWWQANGYDIYFGTFTYNDTFNKDNLDNIKLAQKLKRRVIRTISPIFDDYIINIDFGSENERLHFHTLCAIKKSNNNFDMVNVTRQKRHKNKDIYQKGKKPICKDLLAYEKQVGFFDLEPCKETDESAKKLSNYIDKLTLHSIKVKQAYISVKKGTTYQQYQSLNACYFKEMKKEKRISNYGLIPINNNFYLENLRKYKNKLETINFCDIEYDLLKQKKKEQDEKLEYIKKQKRKKRTKLFDEKAILTHKYNWKRKEIYENLMKKVV